MNKWTNLLFCCALILLAESYVSAQNTETVYREPKFRKLITTKTPQKIKEANEFATTNDEASYYAPIRYVIVYNEILTKINERRIEILIDEKSYNEENLATVFLHIAKKFPSPIPLDIKAHTNLATIETPEERLMMRNSEDSRFKNVRDRYRNSSFYRAADGRESIIYQTSIKPGDFEVIVLKEGAKP